MPVRRETFFPQTPNGALGEILILKTAAGKEDVLFASSVSDGHNQLDQGVVDLCGDDCATLTLPEFMQNLKDHWLPIEDRWPAV
jgi:hypothetical protein